MSRKKKLNRTLKDLDELLMKTSIQSQNSIQLTSHLPLEEILPQPIISSSLAPTEQKVYLQLAIEFQIILSKAFSYQGGLYLWSLLLDDRLQYYGLTRDAWDSIAIRGNQDKQLRRQLHTLIEKITIILKKSKSNSYQKEVLKQTPSIRSFQLTNSTNTSIVSS